MLSTSLANASSDPNAPKRGLSAYMFFANEMRDTVRSEKPGITFGMHHLQPIQAVYTNCAVYYRPSWQGTRREMEGIEYEAT